MAANRRNLPENYPYSFFEQQLFTWSNLTLLAENDQKDLVGYVFARFVDDEEYPHHRVAHIVSVAIDEAYRRKGVAKSLITQLHQQIFAATNEPIHKVSLFVRVYDNYFIFSNSLAFALIHCIIAKQLRRYQDVLIP